MPLGAVWGQKWQLCRPADAVPRDGGEESFVGLPSNSHHTPDILKTTMLGHNGVDRPPLGSAIKILPARGHAAALTLGISFSLKKERNLIAGYHMDET